MKGINKIFLRNSRKNKKFLYLASLVFFIASITIIFSTLFPLSFSELINSNKTDPSPSYKNLVEYKDFPGNQVLLGRKPNETVSDEQEANMMLSGFNMQKIKNDSTFYPGFFYRGFSTYQEKYSSSYLNKLVASHIAVSSLSNWNNYLNYFEKQQSDSSNLKKDIDPLDPLSVGVSFGLELNYLANSIMNYPFFQALAKYGMDNPSLFNIFAKKVALNSGLKYKINSKGDYIFYSNDNKSTEITNMGQLLAASVYFQLPNSIKPFFNTRKFSLNYATIPFDPSNSTKMTYVNGFLNNYSKNNSQLWGLDYKNLVKYLSSNKNYSLPSMNLTNSLQLENQLISDYKNNENFSNVVIPCVVNKTFARQNNVSKGSQFSYHAKVPLIKYRSKTSDDWDNANPEGFFFKKAAWVKNSDYASGVFYHEKGGETNSLSYLSTANKYETITNKVNQIKSISDSNISSNFTFKVVGVSNNIYYKPAMYMNKSIANYINGYTTSWNENNPNGYEYYNNAGDNTTFNAVLSNGNFASTNAGSEVVYSSIGDYTELSFVGTEAIWDEGSRSFSKKPGYILPDNGNIAIFGTSGPDTSKYDPDSGQVLDPNEAKAERDTSIESGWIFSINNPIGIYSEYSKDEYNTNLLSILDMENKNLLVVFVILSIVSIIFLISFFRYLIYKYKKIVTLLKSLGYSNSSVFKAIFSVYIYLLIAVFLVSIPISYGMSALFNKIFFNIFQIQYLGLGINVQVFFPIVFTALVLYGIIFTASWFTLIKVKPAEAFKKNQ